MNAQLLYPTKRKNDSPFYDTPFAVHVPFEMPFDGGAVRVFFDVNIVWDEPEQAAKLTRPGSQPQPLFPENGGGWNFHNQGLYRLDGAAIAPDSATWEVSAIGTSPMRWQTDAPFPVMLNGELPTPSHDGHVSTRLDINSAVGTPKPRRPFTNRSDEHSGFMIDRPLVLRPAVPGWYALWFTLSPTVWAWPAKPLRADDTLRARIIVHYMVVRRERSANGTGSYFTRPDLAWLWEGASEPATRAVDPKLIRLHTVEIPLKLRRDGWTFVRAEVERGPQGHFLDRKLPARDSGDLEGAVVTAQAAPSKQGFAGSYTAAVYMRGGRGVPFPGTPQRTTKLTWDVTFPSEIPDGGAAQIVATGSIERQGGDAAFRNRKPDGYGYSADFTPLWLKAPRRPDPDPHGLGSLLAAIRNEEPGDRAKFAQEWGWKLGDSDGSRLWKQGHGGAPPASRGDERITLCAELFRPPSAVSRRELNPLRYTDIGPQPLFTIEAGPWRVRAHYRRKKDHEKLLESMPASDAVKIADERDSFWVWFPGFSRRLGERLAKVSVAEKLAAVCKETLRDVQRSRRVLVDAIVVASQTPPSDNPETRLFQENIYARMVQRSRALTDQRESLRAALDKAVAEAQEALKAVIEDITAGDRLHGMRHPEVVLWLRHYRAQAEKLQLVVAAATGDIALVREALAKLSGGDLAPETRLLEAQLLVETGAPAEALIKFRAIVRDFPGHSDALVRVRDLECSFIKAAIEKSQGAIAQARAQFQGYMAERGFGARDPRGGSDHAWNAVFADPFTQVDRETAWAIFTTGAVGSLSALWADKPANEAAALAATEDIMTRAYIGLQTILRLRQRGHTLSDMRRMDGPRLRTAIPLKKYDGTPYTEPQVRQLGGAIQDALRTLPELAAIMSEDAGALKAAAAAGYWSDRDVGSTWAEWFGDITSPKNLILTLLPMATTRLGGVAVSSGYWTMAEARFAAAASRAGGVETGTMLVSRMIGWERALNVLGTTERGGELLALIERSQKYQESFGLLGRVNWTLGKVVGTIGVQALAGSTATELGGPEAGLAVEMMLLFAGDTELLRRFLAAGRMPPQKLVTAIRRHHLPAAENQVHQLEILQREVPRLEDAVKAMRESRKPAPPPADAPTLDDLPGGSRATAAGATSHTPLLIPGDLPTAGRSGTNLTGVGSPASRLGTEIPGANGSAPSLGSGTNLNQPIPNGQAGDLLIVARAAENALANNSDNGAAAALSEMKPALAREIAAHKDHLEKVRHLIRDLEAEMPPTALRERPEAALRKAEQALGEYEIPPQPAGTGSHWGDAELALHEGRLDEAEQLWLELRREYVRASEAGRPMALDELPLDIIDQKLETVRGLQRAPNKPPAQASAALGPIDDAKVDPLLASPMRKLGHQGAVAQTFKLTGEPYVVKRLAVKPDTQIASPFQLQLCVEGEVVSAEVSRFFGFPSPGANVRAKFNAAGEMTEASLVYRFVEGEMLSDLSPAQLFHHRDEIAEHRVLSLLLGDYDRKMDNYMLHRGRVHAIDANAADVRGQRLPVMTEGRFPADHPYVIQGKFGLDHHYTAAYLKRVSDPVVAMKTFLSETSLTFGAAEPMLRKIEDAFATEAKVGELRTALIDCYRRIYRTHPEYGASPEALSAAALRMANETIATIELRLPKLEQALKTLTRRNALPLRPRPAAPRRTGAVLLFLNQLAA